MCGAPDGVDDVLLSGMLRQIGGDKLVHDYCLQHLVGARDDLRHPTRRAGRVEQHRDVVAAYGRTAFHTERQLRVPIGPEFSNSAVHVLVFHGCELGYRRRLDVLRGQHGEVRGVDDERFRTALGEKLVDDGDVGEIAATEELRGVPERRDGNVVQEVGPLTAREPMRASQSNRD